MSKRLSKKMRTLLETMVQDPTAWGRKMRGWKDGRKYQGRLRTLWALEHRGLVQWVKRGDKFLVGAEEAVAADPGWVVTERGRSTVAKINIGLPNVCS